MPIPNGVLMMLKAFGVEIPAETLEQINTLIPQLPAIVSGLVQKIEGFDKRLQAIESRLNETAFEEVVSSRLSAMEADLIRLREHSQRDSQNILNALKDGIQEIQDARRNQHHNPDPGTRPTKSNGKRR